MPKCDCSNFRLKGIPCPEACALIIRLGLDPCKFVRGQLKVLSGLSVIEAGLGDSEFPEVIQSSLTVSKPIILPPLLQPPPGRPTKKRKTKESVRRAYARLMSRKTARLKNSSSQYSDVSGHQHHSELVQEDKPCRETKDASSTLSTNQNSISNKRKKSQKHVCSRCGKSGHNSVRCRAYTDGRGVAMKKAEQIDENKLSIIVEIGEPGRTFIPRSMADCLEMIEQQATRQNYNGKYAGIDDSDVDNSLSLLIPTEPIYMESGVEHENNIFTDEENWISKLLDQSPSKTLGNARGNISSNFDSKLSIFPLQPTPKREIGPSYRIKRTSANKIWIKITQNDKNDESKRTSGLKYILKGVTTNKIHIKVMR